MSNDRIECLECTLKVTARSLRLFYEHQYTNKLLIKSFDVNVKAMSSVNWCGIPETTNRNCYSLSFLMSAESMIYIYSLKLKATVLSIAERKRVSNK